MKMAIKQKVRTLTADPAGLAKWLEREAETMHPFQFYREALQNEIEAGATRVIIDGYKAKQGLLARVSGDGSGMSRQKLISHLATVMVTDKGDNNWGIGARIAALPANPAGVTFASKTAAGENMVSLVKQGNVFGLKTWTVQETDEDGDIITTQEEVVTPSHSELEHVKQTGTAVILHGFGRTPTWNNSIAYQVHNYLARRYYQFPGNVSVSVDHSDNHKKILVVPFGVSLGNWASAHGEVPFSDIGGLSGVMFWWVLPKKEDLKTKMSGHNDIGSGIGIVVDDEIFDYGQSHMTDFGIQYRSVQSRVVILVGVWGAKMDTSRSTVVYPTAKKEKRNTPWKALGAYFSEHMPAEIDELMSKVMPSSSIFTEDAAKKLDPDWMKWIKPVPVIVPKMNAAPAIGDDGGDAVPAGDTYDEPGDGPQPENPKPQIAAHRQNSGTTTSGVTKLKTVTPQVKFVPAEEMPEDHLHIYWAETSNTVMISEDFPPYVREVKRWMEKTDHPKSLVETAIKQAYSIEYAAYIVDSNAQRAAQLIPEDIETLKADLSLYGKALGCQSLTEMIEKYLKTAVKAA